MATYLVMNLRGKNKRLNWPIQKSIKKCTRTLLSSKIWNKVSPRCSLSVKVNHKKPLHEGPNKDL